MNKGKPIEVFLENHDEEFIQRMISSGEYSDVSDVVREALFMLEEEDKWKDEPITLSPKGCLGIALEDTSIADDVLFLEDERNKKYDSAYLILEKRMKDAGYITDENGETKDSTDSEKPAVIFSRTIKGFYPKASEEQIAAAWDLFIYHMERHGNLRHRTAPNQ